MHTDRCSQYASAAHQHLLAKHGAMSSTSRLGNCWDNAVAERFFLNLKCVRQRNHANSAEAQRDITDYIVHFYNDQPLCSKLQYQPPNVFEQKYAA